MALQTFNFMQPIHTPDYSGLANLFQNYYKGYETARTPQRIQQEELGRQLQNAILGTQAEYLPQQYESQAQLNRMHGGLYEAQTKEHQLKAQQLQQALSLVNDYLQQNGQAPLNIGAGAQSQPAGISQEAAMQVPPNFISQNAPAYGEGMPQEVPQQMAQQSTQQVAQTQQSPMNPAAKNLAEGIIGNIFHLPEKKVEYLKTGEAVVRNPITGEYEMTKVGPSEEEISEMGETGKLKAQEKEKILSNIESSYSKEPIFQELMQIVNSPEFYQGTGPVSSRVRKLTNNKEVNEMAGKLNYLLGDIVNKASKQFGNRLNKSEYQALQRMKGSDSQNPYEIRSKVKLMYALDKFEREVNSQYYRNLNTKDPETGKPMDRLKAKEKAYKDVDYSDVQNIVRIDDLAYKAAQLNKSDYGAVMQGAQRFSDETGVPLEEALKRLTK